MPHNTSLSPTAVSSPEYHEHQRLAHRFVVLMEILAYRVALVDRSKESVWPSSKSAAVLALVSWSSALQAHQAAMSADRRLRRKYAARRTNGRNAKAAARHLGT
jgi:hypothetical protein